MTDVTKKNKDVVRERLLEAVRFFRHLQFLVRWAIVSVFVVVLIVGLLTGQEGTTQSGFFSFAFYFASIFGIALALSFPFQIMARAFRHLHLLFGAVAAALEEQLPLD